MKAPTQSNSHKHQVFLCWSGELSKALAETFCTWLNEVLPQFRPFFSEEHIPKGAKWRHAIEAALGESRMVVAFVTRANIGVSNWMLYEMAAVGSRNDSNCVAVVLAGLTKSDFSNRPEDPFTERQCASYDEEAEVFQMLNSIAECCKLSENLDERYIATIFKSPQGWKRLSKLWKKAFDDYASAGLDKNPVINSFPHDDAFEKWADSYHHIIHYARHACVQVMTASADHLTKETVQKRLQGGLPSGKFPKSHPALQNVHVRTHLGRIVNYIEKVFAQTVTPAADIWVCLRDLRKDDKFYTLIRSDGSPNDSAQNTLGWAGTCGAILNLKETYERQKCAYIKNRIDYSDSDPSNWWAPVGKNRNPKPAAMMIGAVLTKWVPDGEEDPRNADLWMVLCVSSNKEGVFREAHIPLLQGCNDALSAVANTILAVYKTPPPTKGRRKG
ncbi:MAG: toll/interleukin-1 receptor domain-containing protein [Chthoniobacter sp.]|nr:toll/interleukin-1 receptor domain-containing protein [Chthoniobacter sp.]